MSPQAPPAPFFQEQADYGFNFLRLGEGYWQVCAWLDNLVETPPMGGGGEM